MRSRVVVDTSAVLAMLFMEPGGDKMADAIGVSYISAANIAEVVAKLLERGQTLAQARKTLDLLQMTVEPVDTDLAIASGALRLVTQPQGLSLGDRLCIALAQRLSLPVLTADKTWADLKLGVEVELIR
jgi:ribonuclease VapC